MQSRGKKWREILTEVGKIQSRGKQRQSELQEEGNDRWRQAEAGKRQTEVYRLAVKRQKKAGRFTVVRDRQERVKR